MHEEALAYYCHAVSGTAEIAWQLVDNTTPTYRSNNRLYTDFISFETSAVTDNTTSCSLFQMTVLWLTKAKVTCDALRWTPDLEAINEAQFARARQ